LHSIGQVPLVNSYFVHDYALSKRWMAFFTAPLVIDIWRVMFGFDSFFGALRWRPELGAGISIQSRDGGDPVRIEAEPFLLGHVLGAWDEGDELIVDFTRQESQAAVSDAAVGFRTSDYAGFGGGTVWRYRINPTAGRVSGEELCSLPAEFPRIADRAECNRGRWGYFAANTQPGEGGMYRATLKLDRDSGATELYDFGPRKAALEPVFAPRPGATDEDDGWLLTFVHDSRRRKTDVAILDARRVTDGPVCTLHLPTNAGMTFHGNWVSAEK
jgi:all-trans-8'-apo-beta-carotenal 15,15'-oxygenase